MAKKMAVITVLFSVMLINSMVFADNSVLSLPPGPPTVAWFQFQATPDNIKAGGRNILATCNIYVMQTTYLASIDIEIVGAFKNAVVKDENTGEVLCKLKGSRAELGVEISPEQPLKIVLEGVAPGKKDNLSIAWAFSKAEAYVGYEPIQFVEGLPFKKVVAVQR